MSLAEQYFPPLSRYNRTHEGMSVDAVEAWLDQFPQKRAENKPNGGIIRSVADTSRLDLREMNPKERKVAIAKAQREHRQALKNLANQEKQDAKEIAKQLAAWRKGSKAKRRNSEFQNEKTQEFLDELKRSGFYEVANFGMSKPYLQKIVRDIRAAGYRVDPVRKSGVIIKYKLIKQ